MAHKGSEGQAADIFVEASQHRIVGSHLWQDAFQDQLRMRFA